MKRTIYDSVFHLYRCEGERHLEMFHNVGSLSLGQAYPWLIFFSSSSVHGVLQAGIQECVAICFSRVHPTQV